jgi:hypothetical protein
MEEIKMKYTETEVQKIHENINKIIAYLENITPATLGHFDIKFNPTERHSLSISTYGSEPTFTGWKGCNYDLPFCQPTKPTERTIFDNYEGTLDFCVDVLRHWEYIKTTLQNEIERQNEIRKLLEDFTI